MENTGNWREKKISDMSTEELDEAVKQITGNAFTSTPNSSQHESEDNEITDAEAAHAANAARELEKIKKTLVRKHQLLLDAQETLTQLTSTNDLLLENRAAYEHRPRITDNMPFHLAMNNLIEYEGRPETLRPFCKILRSILKKYGPSSEEWILNYLPKKLKGKAALVFAGIAPTYQSLEAFITDLNLQFGAVQDADLIRMELRQLQQKEDEPITDFSIRVQNLEQRLLAAYEASEGLTQSEIKYQKDRAQKEALESFLYGLLSVPEYRILAQNPKNLREATNIAIYMEGREKLRVNANRNVAKLSSRFNRDLDDDDGSSTSTASSNPDIVNLLSKLLINQNPTVRATTGTPNCTKCGKTGHSENECNRDKECKLCKKHGHSLDGCWRLSDAIDQGEINLQTLKLLHQASSQGITPTNLLTPQQPTITPINPLAPTLSTFPWLPYPMMGGWPNAAPNDNQRPRYENNSQNFTRNNQDQRYNDRQYRRGNFQGQNRNNNYYQNQRNPGFQRRHNNYNNENNNNYQNNGNNQNSNYSQESSNNSSNNRNNYDRPTNNTQQNFEPVNNQGDLNSKPVQSGGLNQGNGNPPTPSECTQGQPLGMLQQGGYRR